MTSGECVAAGYVNHLFVAVSRTCADLVLKGNGLLHITNQRKEQLKSCYED
jgi:hypothetical protein